MSELRRYARRFATAGVVLLLVTGATGCSRPSPAPATPIASAPTSATPTAAKPASATGDINPKDRGALAMGGKLRLAVDALPSSFNPLHVQGQDPAGVTLRGPMTARFFDVDAAGRLAYDPNWLQGEPEVSAGSPTVVTFRLNPKAVWNDGSPIALEDFVATWKACSGKDTEFECATTTGFNRIAGITQGADAHTFVVTFDGTYPDWRQIFLNGPLRAASVADPTAFNTGWSTLAAHDGWFSGPFKIGRYAEGVENLLTLVRNPLWWGEAPLLDEIDFLLLPTDQQLDAYLKGEIDSLDIGTDPAHYNRAIQVTASVVRRAAGTSWRVLALNSKSAPLSDQAIRTAIVQALDRVAIGNVDLAGLNWPVKELNSHLFLPEQVGYADLAAATGLKFDREAAAKTLEGAGWTLGADGYRTKGGNRLTVKYTTLTGLKSSENTGLAVLAQLKSVGIAVTLVPITPTDFAQTLQSGSWELISYTTAGDVFPYAAANVYFNSSSQQNFSGLSSQRIDGYIDAVSGEMDPAARLVDALELEKLAWEQAVLLPLYQRPEQVAVTTGLANFGAFGLETPVWENVGFNK